MYAGLTTKGVAAEAGVTTGSFFHHFPTAADFADAMALSYMEDHQDQIETVEEMLDALEHDDLVAVMRANLTDTWQVISSDPDLTRLFRGQMHLWAHHGQPLHDPAPDAPDGAAILRRTYRIRQDDAAKGWAHLLNRIGLTPVEPFTVDRMATALTALLQGLQLRHAVDPSAVDDELFSDVSTLLTAAVLQPVGSRRRRVADVAAPLADNAVLSPQARSGARRRRETRLRIIDAAVGMFAGGWDSVTASDVAERADVSPQTVLNLFPSVRAVAARTFGRHLPGLITTAKERIDDDPLGSTRDVLERLARNAADDPEPARALLTERIGAVLHHGPALPPHDIRTEVPLLFALLPALERLDLGDAEPVDLGFTILNTVLVHAIPRPGRAAETAELALRLLPDSARHGGRPGTTG